MTVIPFRRGRRSFQQDERTALQDCAGLVDPRCHGPCLRMEFHHRRNGLEYACLVDPANGETLLTINFSRNSIYIVMPNGELAGLYATVAQVVRAIERIMRGARLA